MLEARNIKKSFGKMPVLDGVTLDIGDNITVGLYGESGCGKSTLAKILCGLVVPEVGIAELDGEKLFSDSAKYDRRLGKNIQMVYQQPYAVLDPSQRIIDGIKELIAYHKIVPKCETERLIDSLCRSVELEKDILSHFPHQISGGECQRIAIGKALLLKPRLLILDEATSMLDVLTQANIIALIERERKKSGGSVLLISHDRELLNYCCSIIYNLKDRKIFLEE